MQVIQICSKASSRNPPTKKTEHNRKVFSHVLMREQVLRLRYISQTVDMQLNSRIVESVKGSVGC